MTDGTVEHVDGRPALRFERQLTHSVERVWRAVSRPAELERWFPAAADWTPEVGETFEAGGAIGEVTEVEPPRRLAWTYAEDHYRFDLSASDGGCLLVFTHVLDPGVPLAQAATGWHTYLSRLEPHLAGRHLTDEEAHRQWEEIHERYARQLDVDPTPGRRWIAAQRAVPHTAPGHESPSG